MYFQKTGWSSEIPLFYCFSTFLIYCYCTSLFQSFKSKIMKDSTIKNIGNYTFWLCFILGNICLLGNILTKNIDFAIFGYVLLFLASALNLLIIFGLLIYGLFRRSQLPNCFSASMILCINIPIAALYAYIGITLNSI